MGSDRVAAESAVSGTQVTIPASIRRELGIEDGDQLRWRLEPDGSVRVAVVQQRPGTFAEFDGYDGARETDVASDHDTWGLERD